MLFSNRRDRLVWISLPVVLVLYSVVAARFRFAITVPDCSLTLTGILDSFASVSHLLAYGGFAVVALSMARPRSRWAAAALVFGASTFVELLEIVLPFGTPRLSDLAGDLIAILIGSGAFALTLRRGLDRRRAGPAGTRPHGTIAAASAAAGALIVLTIVVHFSTVVAVAGLQTPRIRRAALSARNTELRPEDLTPWQLNSLLAVEDPGFYSHHGVDFKTPGAGLTTITQSIGKVYYFEHYEQGFRKADLAAIARFVIDPMFTKDEQLTIFLNCLWYAPGVTGLSAAAKHFYGKPPAALDERQWLSLIAMIVGPVRFGVATNPETNQERVVRIERLLSGEYVPVNNADVYYGSDRNGWSGAIAVLVNDLFGR